MHKTLRLLPSLDFLRGFEAAGRRLSFTLAAEELFVTQSALSRQVKALEDALGVALFVRRHRALALTPAGAVVPSDGHRETARARRGSRRRARRRARTGPHRLDHGFLRRAVAHSAAADVSRRAPGRRGLRVRRRPDGGPGARRRRRRGALPLRRRCAADAVRLFGERLLPVASPALVKRGPPLAQPGDLARHVLLHLDDPGGAMPWLNWPAWLTSNGAARPEAGGRHAVLAVRPGDPGHGRGSGRRARPHSADRRIARTTAGSSRRSPSATIHRAATSQ